MMEILRAPAFATIQDGGRDGYRRSGVPPGGAMDRLSLFAGNALLGNEWQAPAIEWALTGGLVRFHSATGFALTGAAAAALLNDSPVDRCVVLSARANDTLRVEHIERGRFLYLCVTGGVSVATVLGGGGTYLPGGFGGMDGRRLRDGDQLRLTAAGQTTRSGARLPPDTDVLAANRPIGVLRGPQADVLSAGQWDALLAGELTVAAESDRAGFRLDGTDLTSSHVPAGKSEPACVGAVQLTPDGRLIVLMPDGPTVGGYPKVAVVTTADLPLLAQKAVGERVRLRLLELNQAAAELHTQMDALRAVGLTGPRRQL